MKTQVTIDLPDGWELADSRLRTPKKGEWLIVPGESSPRQALFDWYNTPTFIVRRIADQYVNVRLRRDDAEAYAAMQWPDKINSRLTDACREALRERCPGYYHANRELAGTCDRGFDYHEYAHKDGTEDFKCTLPDGHAGSHGV